MRARGVSRVPQGPLPGAGQALRALGGREAEAAQLDKAAETYKLGVEHLPWYALALVSIGWLDVISLERVYQPAFERHVLASIAANKTAATPTAAPEA